MLGRITDFIGRLFNVEVPRWLVFPWLIWLLFCMPLLGSFAQVFIDYLVPSDKIRLILYISVPLLTLPALLIVSIHATKSREHLKSYKYPERKKVLIFNASKIEISRIAGALKAITEMRTAKEMFEAVHSDSNLCSCYLYLWLRAVEWHHPELKKCYIVVTDDLYVKNENDKVVFDEAAWSVFDEFFQAYASKRNFEVIYVRHVTGQDPESVRYEVTRVFDDCKKRDRIQADEIIVDITGGTSALSVGEILATISKDGSIEYFPQYRDESSKKRVKELALQRDPNRRSSESPDSLAWGLLQWETSPDYASEEKGGWLPLEIYIDLPQFLYDIEGIKKGSE